MKATRPYLTPCSPSVKTEQPLADWTVFCDFDGPLIDVSERYYSTYRLGLAKTQAVYQARSQKLPLQILSKEQFWQMKRDRVPDVEIARQSGLDDEQTDVFLGQVHEIVNQPHLLHKDRLQPGVRWALGLLHCQGARLVSVTLRHQDQVTDILEKTGLAPLFSGIWGTDDLALAYQNYAQVKTHLLAEAIAEHGVDRDRACIIGDTEADILAAKAVGIPSIAVTCGIRSANYLSQFKADRTYSDLVNAAHALLQNALCPQICAC